MQATMRASVYTQYGAPDVLQIKDVEKPTPKDNEVLIRVRATPVTPTDCAYLKADPFMIRFMNGFSRPKNLILGNMLSGDIEAVGKEVTQFRRGDAVIASAENFATHAGYVCIKATRVITGKPANMSYEEAASLPEAMTPLYFFTQLTQIQPGQHILINGASGALGTFGIQLAKHFGAEVTGVCSTANVEWVKALGADHVIDYTKTDFTQNRDTYDVIFDAVGKRTFSDAKRALKPHGLFLFTVPKLAVALRMMWTSKFGKKKAILGFAGLNQKPEQLVYIKELAEQGVLKTVIDRCYSLDQIADAYRYVDQGHKKGNVIITVG